jgi:flagellar hook-associated protein 3 FlgL
MSSTRVNPYPMPDLLAALGELQRQENEANLQLATGSKINKPSDDPGGAAQLTQVADMSSQVDSYQRSISSINGQLSTADSTLSSVLTTLERAITLGVEGANGTLSDGDRASVVAELQGIKDQLMSLANTTYQGRYIFAGTGQSQPFVEDGNQSSGVAYVGQQGIDEVTIGNGYDLQINLPGSQVFSAPGSDVFQAITDLINAVGSSSGADTAVAGVRGAFDYISSQRVFYDNAMNQTQAQGTFLSQEKLQLSQQQNDIGGADMATVASQVVTLEQAREATFAAIGKTAQGSLFDYLT